MKDDRFKIMFENPEFQVDKTADEYKMLAPVLSRLDKGKLKEMKRKVRSAAFVQADEEDRKSSDDDLFSEKEDDEDQDMSSDEDDRVWTKDLKKQYQAIRKEQKQKNRQGNDENNESGDNEVGRENDGPKLVSLPSNEFKVKSLSAKINKYVKINSFFFENRGNNWFIFLFRTSLGQRVTESSSDTTSKAHLGNLQMKFSTAPKAKVFKQRENELKKHREERKTVIRSIKSLGLKKYVPKQ